MKSLRFAIGINSSAEKTYKMTSL